jgi:hypothetical protein
MGQAVEASTTIARPTACSIRSSTVRLKPRQVMVPARPGSTQGCTIKRSTESIGFPGAPRLLVKVERDGSASRLDGTFGQVPAATAAPIRLRLCHSHAVDPPGRTDAQS